MKRPALICTAVLLLRALSLPWAGADAEEPAWKLRIVPGAVELASERDEQTVIVMATRADGVTRDVTDAAFLALEGPVVARLEANVLRPFTDGSARVTATWNGLRASSSVVVRGADQPRPVSFRLDVMPVFARGGCNSGGCHGAASGKDGFRLSLFGFDPAGDHARLTAEQPGRRINLGLVRESLMIRKALGEVPHSGGQRFTAESPLCETLLRWLRAGAPDDSGDVARVEAVQLLPQDLLLEGEGTRHRLLVMAAYSDGTDRDVTSLATFMTSNESCVRVSPEGVIVTGSRGEAFVSVRFDRFTTGTHVIVLPKDVAFDWPDPVQRNYVDELVDEKLRRLRMAPSGPCSDEVFLRRATIDLTGRLPTAEDRAAFLADDSPARREALVDALMEREAFTDLWVMRLSEMLQIRSSGNVNLGISYKAAVRYHEWLRERLARNAPLDGIVREILASSGGTFENPPTNFFQIEREPKKLAENVAQAFMGMRIQCAQCHNHPFDRWTMDDYYGFVAFFARVARKNAEDPRERIIYDRGGGETRHPVDRRTMQPRFLGGEVAEIKGRSRRAVLAEWLASPDNPWFARNLANVVWAHFFGRGIVEPVDDVRISNPPVNDRLLGELGRRFTEYGYDFRRLVRDICTSRTYQAATAPLASNATDETNFARSYVRRVRAEVLHDMIAQATATTGRNKFRGLPAGSSAVQIVDGRTTSYFLNTFGRASRRTVCACEVQVEPNLSQALQMINGRLVNDRIRAGNPVGRWLAKKVKPAEIVRRLYVRTLCREPTTAEIARILEITGPEAATKEALEDVFWSLLNSKEFMFNH